jgi:hypothetical protein
VVTGDPWALPNPVLLVVLILVGPVVAISLAFRAVDVLTRRGFRPGRQRLTLRYLAMITWSAAIAAYSWGAFHLLQDETSAMRRCRTAVGPEHAGHVASYDTTFFPLRFGCEVNGVGTFEAAVPGYANPVIIGLVVVAITLSVLATFAADKPVIARTGRGRGSAGGATAR